MKVSATSLPFSPSPSFMSYIILFWVTRYFFISIYRKENFPLPRINWFLGHVYEQTDLYVIGHQFLLWQVDHIVCAWTGM